VSELAALQADFQHYLLRGEAAIEARVTGSERVPAAARLAIYGGAYRGRLAEALAANYPALARLLDEDFAELAQAYVAAHDSPYFSIRCYGEDLARFLAAEERYAAAPLLADLARWEWAMTGVFDAADAAPLEAAALAQVAPDAWALLRFRWHPSVTRLDLRWNAPQVWQALTEERERPPAAVTAQATPWLLWRQGLTTYFRSLTPTEAQALDAARSGWPFGELCELLCETVGDAQAPVTAATFLRGWVGAGLISATA
jgi:Putative DNA-binding domain